MFLVASIVQRVPLLAQGLVVREPAAKNAVVRVSSRSEHFRGFIRPSRHAFALESSAPAPADTAPRRAGFTTPVAFRCALPLPQPALQPKAGTRSQEPSTEERELRTEKTPRPPESRGAGAARDLVASVRARDDSVASRRSSSK
ncbi:hypothetical protein CERSUDRAFT_101484 [Gelatoporia subvermispora B]|uniref:Uncharacterized protein n=1 Tax=Ceriporiopsis subvermispora (strain B) TaxID=914234 RepID=M2QWM7_CERS8|nr:hypothetical protein CERSUDRAFT_101484 [Gelatoporia subvermispora B]